MSYYPNRSSNQVVQDYLSGNKDCQGNTPSDLLSESDSNINKNIDKTIEDITINNLAPENMQYRIIKGKHHRLLIRDAREIKKVPSDFEQKNRINHEQHYALLISSYHKIKSYNQAVSFLQDKYKDKIKEDSILSIKNEMANIQKHYEKHKKSATIDKDIVSTTKQDLVTLTKKLLASLEELLDPLKKDLNFNARDLLETVSQFNNMDYNTHVATIYPETNEKSSVTIDEINTHFTQNQKDEYIQVHNWHDKNSSGIKRDYLPLWFKKLNTAEQYFVGKYAQKIADGRASIPAHLGGLIPGVPNLYNKSMYQAMDKTKELKLRYNGYHSGVPIDYRNDNTQVSLENLKQLNEIMGKDILIHTLNSAMKHDKNPISAETPMVKTLQLILQVHNNNQENPKIKSATSAINGLRMGNQTIRDHDEFDNLLSKLADTLPDLYLNKESTKEGDQIDHQLIKQYLKKNDHDGNKYNKTILSIEEICTKCTKNSDLWFFYNKILYPAIVTKRLIHSIRNSKTGLITDKENAGLFIAAHTAQITGCLKTLNLKELFGLKEGDVPNFPDILYHCKSGRDRTGLASHFIQVNMMLGEGELVGPKKDNHTQYKAIKALMPSKKYSTNIKEIGNIAAYAGQDSSLAMCNLSPGSWGLRVTTLNGAFYDIIKALGSGATLWRFALYSIEKFNKMVWGPGSLTEMVSGLYYSHTSSIDTIDGVMGSSHDNIRGGSQSNDLDKEISEENAVNRLIKRQAKQKSKSL